MPVSKRATRFLWIAVIFLVVVGVAAVTRRTLVLLWPGQFAGKASPAAALDAGFARHMALTLLHILPGALFLTLALFQFMPGIRQKHLQFHRWTGRVLVICGLIIGVIQSLSDSRLGPQWTEAVVFGYLIGIMVLRPRGLLGEETREAG